MTDTREELLQAGVLLYTRLRSSHLQSLTAERVAKAAGFHRQTFYRYWDTQAEYVQDLIRFAFGGENDPVAEGIREPVAGESESADFESFMRALARDEFARFATDPMREFRFGLIATRGGPEEIDEFVVEFVRRIRIEGTNGIAALLGAWDREPAPPYTTLAIALAVESLAMGLSLAEPFVDESVAANLYQQLIGDLFLTMTRQCTA